MNPTTNTFLNNANILITGGTGSFGQKFIEMTLNKFTPNKIIVYSRDEMKQADLARRFHGDSRLRFFIGDVRDRDRLYRACQGVDVIIHAAALKIVPTAEYNPFECIKTNINGAVNVIDCAIDLNIKQVVALSTDKACQPINLYGATKLCSDKLFVAANAYVGSDRATRFSVVRYGNVMGSRGSIIPLFRSMLESEELPITDPRMTRFMISLNQGVELVWHALQSAVGGEIFVKKIPSMKVVDIAATIAPQAKLKIVGIRPGEKLHEQMIVEEDASNTLNFPDHYVILPQIDINSQRFDCYADTPRCSPGFRYSSDTNDAWMSQAELQEWLTQEYSSNSLETKIVTLNQQLLNFNTLGELLQKVVDAPDLKNVPQLRLALAMISDSKPEQALEHIRQIIKLAEATPEIHLAGALAHVASANYRGAFTSLVRVLGTRADSPTVRKLMADVSHSLGSDHVFDCS